MAEETKEYLDLDGLTEYHSKINDDTTGINLVKGTRDFKNGTTAVSNYGSTTLYSDGVNYSGFLNRSSYQDTDGFTVIDFSKRTSSDPAGAIYSSVVEGLTVGDEITVSVDVLVSDNLNSESRYFLTANESNASNERVTFKELLLSELTGDISTIEKNKWYTVKLHYTIKNSSTKFFFVMLVSAGGQLLSFRKLMVQRGHVNNPIWSASPFDFVSGPINDFTTGINLLRGTRDFIEGTKKSSLTLGTNSVWFEDGFRLPHKSYMTFTKDENGFTVATMERSGLSTNSYTRIDVSAFDLTKDGTASFDIRINSDVSFDGGDNPVVITYYSKSNVSTNRTLQDLTGYTISNIPKDEWVKAKTTLSKDTVMFIIQLIRNGSISVRKICLYEGDINHPIWSASPFDTNSGDDVSYLEDKIKSINDYTTGINLARGTRDFTAGTDKYGAYYSDGFLIYTNMVDLTKDEDGFTVATEKSTTGSHYDCLSSLIMVNPGDELTFSFDVRQNKLSSSDNMASLRAWSNETLQSFASSATSVAGPGIGEKTFSNFGLNKSSMEIGTWHQAVFKFTVPANVHILSIGFGCSGDADNSFRKLMIQRGNINHPIWSPSPFDNNPKVDFSLNAKSEKIEVGNNYVTHKTYTDDSNNGFFIRYTKPSSSNPKGVEIGTVTNDTDTVSYSIADKEDILSSINDLTTGINLLRGTRDFRAGTEKVTEKLPQADLCTDGFIAGSVDNASGSNSSRRRLIDKDGFTVLEVSLYSNWVYFAYSYLPNLIAEEYYTIFLDFKITDGSYPESAKLCVVNGFTDQNSMVDLLLCKPNNMVNNEKVEVGKWCHGVWHFKVNSSVTCGMARLLVENTVGTVQFRKFGIYKGKINNPIWSASPLDIDYINDETTGINLLRGTRDFTAGTVSSSNSTIKTNGFNIYPANTATYSRDKDGFAIARISHTASANLYSSAITSIKAGETYTAYFEYMFDEKTKLPGSLASLQAYNGSQSLGNSVAKISQDDFDSVEIGKWYGMTVTYTIPSSISSDNGILFVMLHQDANVPINFRKVCIYKGKINHPVWSMSPFDFEAGGDFSRLEGEINKLNDFTTGINLLRGTRDFTIATTPYVDGFNIASTMSSWLDREVREDGFTVLSNYSSSGHASLDSSVFYVSSGDTITVSLEYKVNDTIIDDFYVALKEKSSGKEVARKTISSTELNRHISGDWYDLVANLDIPVTADGSKGFYIETRLLGYKQMTICKLMAQKGSINRPIWSASPFDVPDSGASIDNETIGINLLRGTRDLVLGSGSTVVGTGVGGYLDSWINGGNYQFYKDEIGFTVAHKEATDRDSNGWFGVNSNLITYLHNGDEITYSFEYMIDDVTKIDAWNLLYLREEASANKTIDVRELTYGNPATIESGVWYKAVYHYTMIADDMLQVGFRLPKNGSVNFRKPLLYKGRINNPVWAASPFDVSSAEVEEEAPLLLGKLKAKHQITSGSLNTYIIPGTYASISTGNGSTITDRPSGSLAAFTLDVRMTQGSRCLRQIFTEYNAIGKTWIRFSDKGDGTDWTDWVETVNNKTIISLNQGGTGGKTGLAAQYNILKTMETSQSDVTDSSLFIQAYNDMTASEEHGKILIKPANTVWNWIETKIKNSSNSFVYRGEPGSGNKDFNLLVNSGMYRITKGGGTYENDPASAHGYGVLLVFNTNGYVHQLRYVNDKNDIYNPFWRYSADSGSSWSNWKQFAMGSISEIAASVLDNRTDVSTVSLDTVTDPGTYVYKGEGESNKTQYNRPSTVIGRLFVTNAGETNRVMQIAMDRHGKLFARHGEKSGITEPWKTFLTQDDVSAMITRDRLINTIGTFTGATATTAGTTGLVPAPGESGY